MAPIFELSAIKAMEIAASKIPNSISLAQGIPSFPTPQVIKDFVHEKINAGLCDKYSLTLGLNELREEISLSLKDEGLNFDPDTEIIATAGSIQGITASILALTSPGDEVILQSPSYVAYQGAIAIARCKAVFVPLDEDNNFDFDIEAMQKAITPKTKVILYCSPNNPTGTLFSEAKTRKIVELAEKRNIMILVDEVYKDFYYSNDKHFSAMHIKEARKRVVRVCSFSKAYAMTGWRIGFVHADRSIIQNIVKFHDAMVSCAPVVSQYAAIAALRLGGSYLEHFRNEFRKRRDYTIEVLDSLSHILDYQLPKATYFAFPRIKDTVPLAKDSHALAYDILNKAALALVPGSAFGPSGESHLRINFGREKKDIEEGMERFRAYFNNTAVSKTLKTAPVKEASTVKSLYRSIIKNSLAFFARTYLRNNKPLIIGIAGLKGKTVYKRFLFDLLSKEKSVRSNLLSYNTAVGFPLSILNLENPSGKKNYFSFVRNVLKNSFSPDNKTQILILEYGISNKTDAEHLLTITKPDWLLLTEIAGGGSGETRAAAEGIKLLAENVPLEKILWTENDFLISDMHLGLKEGLSIKEDNIADDELLKALNTAHSGGNLVGGSAKSATIAGIIMGKSLGISKDSIMNFLNGLI